MEWAFIIKALVGVIAIVDPVGAIPVYLGMSSGKTRQERRVIARTTGIAVGSALVVTLWTGQWVLKFFGIGIPSFQVGGGILILLMAMAMLHASPPRAKHTQEEAEEATDKADPAVVPLAIPLMAGPGALSMVIVTGHQAPGLWDKVVISGGFVLIGALAWLTLRLSEKLGNYLGVTGINIINRVMGMVLAAIGVQFIATGLKVLLPGLG